MRLQGSPHLFGGYYNLSLERKKFDPSKDDIERICLFFHIGKLHHYEKEKDITISHDNHFVFIATARGKYALKFYPMYAAKRIFIEYAINRTLASHHFPTPQMFSGHGGQPFCSSNGLLATCFSFIDGRPALQGIKEISTIRQINAAMLSLKNILSAAKGRIPFLKQPSLTTTINALAQASRAMAPSDQKKTIDASLKDVYRTYQQHQPLFIRQCLFNNAVLPNFLLYKKTVYAIDLEHCREDYAFCDLAKMVLFMLPAS